MAKTLIVNRYENTRVPFLRGILIRSLQDAGLDFDDAFGLASSVRDDISELPEMTSDELRDLVQEKLEAGDPEATKIWESMGYYMGYTLAHYADFYELKHVLILGRCTSGRGGDLIVQGAHKVLESEFPELAQQINVQLSDEKARRVGQSIAAASLPAI